MLIPRRWFVGLLLGGALSGCSSLPSSGPTRAELEDGNTDDLRQYLLVEVDDRTLSLVSREKPQSLGSYFGSHRAVGSYLVGVGDGLTITLWEAGAGGLFSGPVLDRLGTGSRSATIPEQQVGQDGSISVPYAGRLHVAGKTTSEIEAMIVRRLTGKAIEPQAVVIITRPLSNSATVLGEVTNGARVPLSPAGDRLLDVIATAGGIRAPAHEIFVRLTRGSGTVTVPMQTILMRPSENVFVRPGDTITLIREPQTFTAFGATGQNAIVPFDAIGITLEEAVAKVGGLIDSRADPAGIYVMRFEPASFAKILAGDRPIPANAGYVRVIYHWNMRDPNALFLARGFRMHNKDVLYVANATLAELQKITALFNTVAQPVVTGIAVSRVSR